LALKICLIVEKHAINRRWHFDTILKVLVLADQAVKEESAKSLVYLVQSTPQLQEYCLAKLFFSASENPQNDALGSVTLFLIGELSHILFKIKGVSINEQNVLDLIESIVFKAGILNDTISYGLSCLLKLYEKLSNKERVSKMIRSFEAHSDLEVQKRACEYTKLL
jgi:AP-1 complex subunit gamma-1